MIEQHITNEQFTGYQQGGLPPLELLMVDDHLAGCGACREKIPVADAAPDEMLTTLREALLPQAEGPPKHLAYEQIEALVDGTLSEVEREIMSAHLFVCASCTDEVQELSMFRASLIADEAAPELAAETTPAPVEVAPQRPQVINVAPPVQVGYEGRRRGWWRRLKARLSTPTDWSLLEGAVLAVVATAVVLGVAYYAQRVDQTRRVAQNNQPAAPPSMPMTQPPIMPMPQDTPLAMSSPGPYTPVPLPSAPGGIVAQPPDIFGAPPPASAPGVPQPGGDAAAAARAAKPNAGQ